MTTRHRLTEQEIAKYAEQMVGQMSDDDCENFLGDPDGWQDGIVSNHCIAVRDDEGEIYIHDEWPDVRDAILAVIRARK